MRKRVAGIVAVVAVLASATAANAQEKLSNVFGLSIPDRVGSLLYSRSVDYESKRPGLGYGLTFIGLSGWIANVYFYDLGLKTIPPDPQSDLVKKQLAQAKGDVVSFGQRGMYVDVTDKGEFVIPETGAPRFLCANFNYRLVDRAGTPADSYLCLTAWNGKFVKMRMTARLGNISRSDVQEFANAWTGLLR